MQLPKDVRAVVTGGGSGLGRAFATELGARGGRILVADVDEAGGEQTVTSLRASGVAAHFVRCDARDAAQVEALADAAEARFGGADLVVNNAGVAVSGKVGEVALEDWRFAVDVNLLGVIHGCHTFVPRFVAQGRGFVVNVASAAGLLSPPEMGPYNATKAAVVALSETLHAERARDGISVTVACPTFFATNLMSTARGPERHAKAANKLMSRSRIEASDVAREALAALEAGRVHSVAMLDGRAMWALKRLMPSQYAGLVAWLAKRDLLPK